MLDLITLALAKSAGGGGGADMDAVRQLLTAYATTAAMNTALAGKADVTALENYATAAAVRAMIADAVGEIIRFEYYLCGSGEYDAQGVPTVTNPDTNHIYLVPTTGTNLNMYAYISGAFTFLGTTEMDLTGYVTEGDLEDALGDYATLAALQALSGAMPTKVSDLANDAGYLTQHQDISGKADTEDLADVAFSGSYSDLTNKPTIPTMPVNVVTGDQNGYYIRIQSTTPATGTDSKVITIVV